MAVTVTVLLSVESVPCRLVIVHGWRTDLGDDGDKCFNTLAIAVPDRD